MTDIKTLVQQPAPDAVVELFTLDATNINGQVYYFCSSQDNGSEIEFDGNTYSPIDVEADGFQLTGNGPLPEPTLRVSNATGVMGAVAIAASDLLGTTVTRVRTFGRYLDNGSEPDPTAVISEDVYIIDQKTAHNQVYIEWKLASVIGFENRFVPARQVIRDICTHRYRIWDGSAFVYTNATCPYTGANYYTQNGTSSLNPALDSCGKRIEDCVLRFGTGELPTRAFPGSGRARIR